MPVRFGVYGADTVSEELRKNGLKIRLTAQPFQVLAMMLERPGQIVTREELQKKLWPDGTFVDFDHSLNTAINKIREALGDSAENPRFVGNPGSTRLPVHRAGGEPRFTTGRPSREASHRTGRQHAASRHARAAAPE